MTVWFSCHTHIVKSPCHCFYPFQRFRSGYLASRMDMGSTSCNGGSDRHSLRERQPANCSNQEKYRQCSNTQRERTDTQPTSDEYNERFFELRSVVVSILTVSANALYLSAYGGCQNTEHTGTNSKVFGASIRRKPAGIKACCHTQNGWNAEKILRLIPSSEKRSCAVTSASSTQPIFKIQQPKKEELSILNETIFHRSNISRNRSTNRSQKMRSQAR